MWFAGLVSTTWLSSTDWYVIIPHPPSFSFLIDPVSLPVPFDRIRTGSISSDRSIPAPSDIGAIRGAFVSAFDADQAACEDCFSAPPLGGVQYLHNSDMYRLSWCRRGFYIYKYIYTSGLRLHSLHFGDSHHANLNDNGLFVEVTN